MDSRLVLPVNAIVDGYRILRVVGTGGFGITYEAEDLNLGLMVAIKEYYPFDFGDRDSTMSVRPKSARHKHTFEWGRSNFLQEARTLARFEHPSIVRVTRVFEAHATAYMVMRFEKGPSLEEWLRDLGRPPAQEELDAILHPLLDALELMHGANFLHRDIAPDNIIIRPDGTPVLLDFGAARRSASDTEPAPQASRPLTGVIKAGYSPHEQYTSDGRMQGPWSDLYALGGTLYRAVAGRPPEEATLRFDEDLMPSAAELGKDRFRPDFLEAIDACLKVRHSERPRSVAQLRPMLLGHRSQINVVELSRSRTPSLPRTLAPPPRHRWVAAAAVAVLVAGLAGGLAYKSTSIAVARQSPEMNVVEKAEKKEDRQEAQRRKDIADAAEADALRQAEADAAAERKREDELRTAALDEARRRDERRKEDERVRLATIPSGEEQAAFVKRVQEVLKRNQCHDGNVTGRADETQESVDRFVENAKRSGQAQAPRIRLAEASVGDYESWLAEVEKARWEPCVREAPKVERARAPIATRYTPSRAQPSYVRQPAAPRYARSYSNGGGSSPGLMLGIGH